MTTICTLLKDSQLPDSPSARLDTELLLAAAMGKPRSFLRTWPERIVPREANERFDDWIARRRNGEPVAYILGHQGFWSLDLEVAPHTLIPRPDTELLVETALATLAADTATVLDLGTGTGAIALALASERPLWTVTAVDRVEEAVALAERNRQRLLLENVEVRRSHWFSALDGRRFRMIVGNPPYIPASDPHLSEGDVRFEPKSALVAGSDGLDDIRQIVAQAPRHLLDEGWLLLEHGYDQGAAVRELLGARGFAGYIRCATSAATSGSHSDNGHAERRGTAALQSPDPAGAGRRRGPAAPEAQPRTDRRSWRPGFAGGAVPGRGRVGELHLADFDTVDLTNLQRQVIHDGASVGIGKVESAMRRLGALNPQIRLVSHSAALDEDSLDAAVAAVDLVLDCTDNFATREAVNVACVRAGKPLVSGAAIRLEGQLSVFDTRRDASPCYHCLYGHGSEAELTCSEAGVIGPLVGLVGSLQALEALKLLAGFGEPLVGRLLLVDALGTRFRELRVRRDPSCAVCGQRHGG